MSNLTNVYAYVRDKFQDVDMVYGKSPSFIKTLAGIDSYKIIFIYKEDVAKLKAMKDYQSPTSERIDNKSDTNFNFSGSINSCGSPLKDDNSINDLINTSIASKVFNKNPWRDMEEGYGPIDVNLAQKILNDIANQKFPKDSGWVFILCGSDTGQDLKNSMFLISFNVSKKKFTRGFAKYYGVVKNDNRSIRNYIQQHKVIIPRSTPEILIESTFEMTTDVSLKFVNKMNEANGTLSHINDSSQVWLYQKVEIGKSHILCEQLWNQIQLLYMIKNDIVNVKNLSCDGTLIEPAYNYGSMKYEDLQKKCNVILSDVVSLNENAGVIDISLEATIRKVFNRPLIEITDQIWELIKYASSYYDLRRILTFIFQISSRSCIVNIPMNNNRLAELIREISQQRLAIPHLSSTEPLELLLEIGIEKVMKDYEFIFSESKICLLNEMKIVENKIQTKTESNMNVRKSLAPSALEMNQNRKTLLHGTGSSLDSNDDLDGIRNSRFSEKESDKKISKMAQIHLAIEHIMMMQNNLNMDYDYKHIARRILENPIVSFEDLQTQKYDKLHIAINDKKVIQLVDNLMPNSQKVTIKSDNKYKSVENVFYFNIEQIVPSLMQKESEGEVVDKKGDTFHFINYASITSKH